MWVVLPMAQARLSRRTLLWLLATVSSLLASVFAPIGFVIYVLASQWFIGGWQPIYTLPLPVMLNGLAAALLCTWVVRGLGVPYTWRTYRRLAIVNTAATGLRVVMMIVKAVRHPIMD